ncbi:hypothetical protein LSPCS325_09170 [Lysinibacillus sp. CTST325]
MDQKQLNAIKERVANATPGPWVSEETAEGHIDILSPNEYYTICQTQNENIDCLNEGNTEFIKHSITDVTALVVEVERLREMLRGTRKTVRLKVKEVKTLQNACKKHKAKQEALEFQLKVSIRHAEELDEELESEVAENEQLRKALEKIMEVEAPIMEGCETSAYKIARQALGGEAHE